MATGTIRYWAAAKAAAGVDEETADASTLEEALAVALARTDRPRLAEVLKRCSFVVDGHPTGRRPHDEVMLAEGWVVEALPPFAGG